MKNIQHLNFYPSFQEALDAIDLLESAYLKAHKRRNRSELTVAAFSDSVEVRCHFAQADRAEATWFIDYLNENKK